MSQLDSESRTKERPQQPRSLLRSTAESTVLTRIAIFWPLIPLAAILFGDAGWLLLAFLFLLFPGYAIWAGFGIALAFALRARQNARWETVLWSNFFALAIYGTWRVWASAGHRPLFTM